MRAADAVPRRGTQFRLGQLPNLLSAARLGCAPILWVLCLTGRPATMGWLLPCLATDVIDGWLARRLGFASSFGAKLDSAADNVLLVSAPIWMALLVPEVLRDHLLSFGGFVVLLLTVFGCMLLKYRRNVEIQPMPPRRAYS